VKQQLLGPAGLALAAVLVLSVVAPPEVRGSALAAMALFIVGVSVTAVRSSASFWVVASVPLVLFAIRAAIAPGEAVEPAVVILLAAAAGIGAATVSDRVETLAPLFAALLTFAGGRALYETFWGLSAAAERLRDAAPAGDALAMLIRLEQGRPYGGFSTPAALGCFLIMTLPAVAAWALGRRGAVRVLGMGAVALGTSGLIATRSVSAMAALACALSLAGLRGRLAPRLVAVSAGALGLAILAAALVRPDAVLAPTRWDSPWRLRAGNVRVALSITRDHPLAGVGPGGFAEAFSQYRQAGDNESRHAHDLPAELLAEWGVPVGLALSALFFWVFVGPVLGKGGNPLTLTSGLAVGLAAFAIHNVADFTAFLPSLLVFAAVCRGLCVPSVPKERASASARAAWVALVLAVAVVAAGSGLARDALFDARQAAAEGDHEAGLRLALRAERLAPWDADPPRFAAEARLASGAGAEALVDAERAVRRAPSRAATRMVRSRARSAVGDLSGAYADVVEAHRLYPLHPDYAAQRDALGSALETAISAAPR
jgi:hypothetical protein